MIDIFITVMLDYFIMIMSLIVCHYLFDIISFQDPLFQNMAHHLIVFLFHLLTFILLDFLSFFIFLYSDLNYLILMDYLN